MTNTWPSEAGAVCLRIVTDGNSVTRCTLKLYAVYTVSVKFGHESGFRQNWVVLRITSRNDKSISPRQHGNVFIHFNT